MTPGQQVGVGFASGAAVAVVAALVAVVTAIALSTKFPLGFARRAEVDLGWRVDGPVITAGAFAIAVLIGTWSAIAARLLVASGTSLTGRRAPRRRSTSRLVRSIGRAGAPPTAAVGVGMAFDSHGSGGAVPVRISLATMTAVIAAVAGTLVFASSLDHLVATPSLQGWRWDALLTGDVPKVSEQLARDRAVTALAGGGFATIRIDGHEVAALALSPIRRGGFAAIVDGRAPSKASDIALGAKTMDVLRVSIGDRLAIGTGASRRRMLVVGRAVMPSGTGYPGMALSDGALLTGRGLEELGIEETDFSFVAVRFTPGSDIQAHTAKLGAADVIAESPLSAEVEDLRRVAGIPRVLAAVFGLIAIATIFHLLVTTIHRRRRELALLRALGFRRRQVVSTLGWQASTVTMASIIAGIPLGIAAGRWAWNAVAHSLGVPAVATTPVLALLAVGVGAILLANIVTWLAGSPAAHISPATALRAD
jgi:hypothetical protein